MGFTGKYAAIVALKAAATQVRKLEEEAVKCRDTGETEKYFSTLRDKALLLVDLPQELDEHLADAPILMAERVRSQTADFARRANMALTVGSPFFMLHLLYPDDWQEGMPNELESFIKSLDVF